MPAPVRFARTRLAGGALVVLTLVGVAAGGTPSVAARLDPDRATPAPTAATAAAGLTGAVPVRLVTGELLQVDLSKEGRPAVAIVDEGIAGALLQYTDAEGDLHVVPYATRALVGEQLDERLFNVSALVRGGYGMADRPELPVIVTFTGAPVAVPGVRITRTLASIDGVAGVVDAEGALALGAELAGSTADEVLAGVERIWLDGPITAALDESVPQIGAPAAWDLGFDGSGITIAVVDSGVSEAHPDLAGRVVASELFAEGASPDDVLGHGTHVASIAAGSGAASDEQYVGVAYGAEIVSAKVLDDFGSGLESWVIAGIEWAATEQDADVVNLSINGGPTDGTDPVSQAINALSASTDALFVASAGNFGPGRETVETPATADAALGVGAVDKSDQMAFFSAEGPRAGDLAVKPEIVAPGYEITAARAAGSEIGEPVGDDYMILSGTSMATPHVSGAAALLRQANPGWTWDQVKNALVTSATRLGHSAYTEGGGRVDVPTALAQTVHADVATLNLGRLEYPHDDGETSSADVTLTNDGSDDVTLTLDADAITSEGEPASDAMLTVDDEEITIAPGASVTVAVTFDPATGPLGLFGGALVASAGDDEALHVPLGFEKEPQRFTLTMEAIDPQGGDQGFGDVFVVELKSGAFFGEAQFQPGAPVIEMRVPGGTYAIIMYSPTVDETSFMAHAVVEPELVIDSDVEVSLDTREAVEATYQLESGDDPTDLLLSMSTARGSEFAGVGIGYTAFGFPEMHVFATPTDPISLGTLDHGTQWQAESDVAVYTLPVSESGEIPEDLTYELGPDDLASIVSHYSRDLDGEYYVGRFGLTAGGASTLIVPEAAPGERFEIVTTQDVVWWGLLYLDPGGWIGFERLEATYAPGDEIHEHWLGRPVRPGLPIVDSGGVPYGPARYGDFLEIVLATFLDPESSYGWADPGFEQPSVDTVSYTLRADGELVSEGTELFVFEEVSPEPATFELVLETERDTPYWLTSTETRTMWQFESEHASGELSEPLDVLQVDYAVELDPYNHHEPGPVEIGFRPYNLAVDGESISGLTAQWSVNDGRSWHDVTELLPGDDGWWTGGIGLTRACDEACYVTLRVVATGDGGAMIDQEITRAFQATYVAPTSTPTLPPTGSGEPATLAWLAALALLAGAVAVGLARRRLGAPE